jgi:hypothetical protein
MNDKMNLFQSKIKDILQINEILDLKLKHKQIPNIILACSITFQLVLDSVSEKNINDFKKLQIPYLPGN